MKDELASTAVQITCYDRDGKEVKRVTSTDDGNVEDPENENGITENGNNENQNENGGGSGSLTPSGGDDNGGGNGGGNDVVYGPRTILALSLVNSEKLNHEWADRPCKNGKLYFFCTIFHPFERKIHLKRVDFLYLCSRNKRKTTNRR